MRNTSFCDAIASTFDEKVKIFINTIAKPRVKRLLVASAHIKNLNLKTQQPVSPVVGIIRDVC